MQVSKCKHIHKRILSQIVKLYVAMVIVCKYLIMQNPLRSIGCYSELLGLWTFFIVRDSKYCKTQRLGDCIYLHSQVTVRHLFSWVR
jgi:hypothetical protein